MRRYLLPSALLVVCSLCAMKAQADIVLAYSVDRDPTLVTGAPIVAPPTDPGPIGNVDIIGEVGDVFRINVFATATAGDTRLSDFGLTTAGFAVNYDTALGDVVDVTRTNYLRNDNFQNVLLFRDNGFQDFDDAAGRAAIGGLRPIADPAPGLGTNSAFIGFFDYRIAAEGTNQFVFSDPNPGPTITDLALNNNPDFTQVDTEVFAGSGVVNIGTTAIPEPGSLVFLAGVACIGVARRRRRS